MYDDNDLRGQKKLNLKLSIIPKIKPLPVGAFSLIVADPSWQYHLRETDSSHRGRCPYPPMADAEIKAMAVDAIANDDAYLLLWTTNSHISLALEVMNAWGFEYKTMHTWVKTTIDGSKIRFGLGHYGRNATEHFLVGRKGKAKSFTTLGLTDVPTAFHAPVGRHSQKPEAFYALAERLSTALGGQRIELFARLPRPDWHSWGAEI